METERLILLQSEFAKDASMGKIADGVSYREFCGIAAIENDIRDAALLANSVAPGRVDSLLKLLQPSLDLRSDLRDAIATADLLLVKTQAPAADGDDAPKKKRKPTSKTVEIIRFIQSGKDNDEVVEVTGATATNVRTIRARLNAGEYEI